MDDVDHIRRQLIDRRNALNLSQRDVAQRMGISQPALAARERIQQQRLCSVPKLKQWAKALGLHLELTLTEDEPPPAPEASSGPQP